MTIFFGSKLRLGLINGLIRGGSKIVWSTVAVAAVIGLMGCGGEPRPKTEARSVTVYTTSYPLEFLLRRVGGERIEVVNLVSPGMDPHHYEPTPRQVAAIQSSHLFVYNGAGLEDWVSRVIESLPPGGPVVIDATAGLDLKRREAHGAGHKHGHAGEHGHSQTAKGDGELDPHVWLDPQLYANQAERLWQALLQLPAADPDAGEYYTARFKEIQKALHELDQEAATGLAQCQRRVFVVSHAAFGYLASRYNLKQIAVAGLSPEVEPSPGRMREVVREIRRHEITHIFFESAASPAVAKVLAREVGAETLVLDPIETLTDAQIQSGEDYFSLMRSNLKNLRKALACR